MKKIIKLKRISLARFPLDCNKEIASRNKNGSLQKKPLRFQTTQLSSEALKKVAHRNRK